MNNGSNYNSPWQISTIGSGTFGGISLNAASQNTISLSGIQDSVETDWFNRNNLNVKKYQIVETTEDLLALSTTWKRLRDERQLTNENGFLVPTSLIDNTLFHSVTNADRDLAGEIRDFYSKKIVYWKLKDIPLSQFRQAMSEFIHTDGKHFKEEILPLVYRLPEFYEYDIQFEELSRQHNQSLPVVNKASGFAGTKTLTLVKTLVVNKKRLKRKEYWFTDTNDNLVLIPIESSNSLMSLLDLVSKNPIRVEGKFQSRTTDHTEYLLGKKITFI
jgi:hypothetical protein